MSDFVNINLVSNKYIPPQIIKQLISSRRYHMKTRQINKFLTPSNQNLKMLYTRVLTGPNTVSDEKDLLKSLYSCFENFLAGCSECKN